MPTARVYLFDIDGTLVESDGQGREAMEAAFESVTGHRLASFSFGGMTDPGIVREGLLGAGLAHDDETVDAVLSAYVDRLPQMMNPLRCRRIDGVDEALAVAEAHPTAAIGVGTGNVEMGAHFKLAAVGLMERFAFGGYGSDAENRAELLRVGADRGAARLGRDTSSCEVVVIGDTPRDVDAARALGARCLAVATGACSLADLLGSEPDLAVETLQDDRALAFLAGTT